jgi:hypothetical protein
MSHTQPPRQRLESGVHHFIHIADGAVRDGPHAAQRTMNVAVDLAPKRAVSVRLVQILHHVDFGARRTRDLFRVLGPRVRIARGMLAISRLNHDRNGAAHHRAGMRHEVGTRLQIEAVAGRILTGDLLPSVINCRSIPAAQFQHIAGSELSV